MSDKNLLEKIKAEYEQKIAEMELRHKQEMDLLKEQLSSMRKLLFSSKSERTKIVCKRQRFGWIQFHPLFMRYCH